MNSTETIIILLARKNSGPSFGYPLLGKEFQEKGYHVEYIEANSPLFLDTIKLIFSKQKVKFVLTHNHLCIDKKINGQYFYDYYNTVFITLTDTPLNKYSLTLDSGRNVAFLIGDYRFRSIMSTVGKGDKVYEWYGYNNYYEEKDNIPLASRKIDILFPARIGNTIERTKEFNWFRKKFAFYLARKYFKLENKLQLDELIKKDISTFPFYFRRLASKILLPSEKSWIFLFNTTHIIRTKRRQWVIEELEKLNHNFRITIITDNENVKKLKKTLKREMDVLPFMPWPEAINLMRNSKIVINTLPFQAQSHHERIATAQYCGSAVFSDINEYLFSQYKEEKDIVYYSFSEANLGLKLNNYLGNLNKLQLIADSGKEVTYQYHMPKNRAEYILRICDKIKS